MGYEQNIILINRVRDRRFDRKWAVSPPRHNSGGPASQTLSPRELLIPSLPIRRIREPHLQLACRPHAPEPCVDAKEIQAASMRVQHI